ncbi:MAG: translation elongation factor Ts [Nitrospirae bacterium]|nr:translation elongation factor Ts [Nitrospirota bacterium]
MSISAGMVKEMREKTGVGMMECKKALTESGGDFDKALEILRKKGLATASKKSTRKASEGIIYSYIHMDKIGVMIELNCETDFVAKTYEFKALAKDVAMQIAASSPQYISPDDISADVVAKEKEIYRAQIQNKPANVIDKIVEGKLEKFFSDTCLMKQVFVKDSDGKMTINDLLVEKIAKLGENIVIRRFARYQVGENQDSAPSSCEACS